VTALRETAVREPLERRTIVALDQASDWGWGSPRIIGLLVICDRAAGAPRRLARGSEVASTA
jgi:hypothetical protein